MARSWFSTDPTSPAARRAPHRAVADDGAAHPWSVNVPASFGSPPEGAVWRMGQAIAIVNGGAADGMFCGGPGGGGTSNCIGNNVSQTIRIGR